MRKVFEAIGVFFPVPTVEVRNPNVGNGFRLEAADVDADTVRIGTRNIK